MGFVRGIRFGDHSTSENYGGLCGGFMANQKDLMFDNDMSDEPIDELGDPLAPPVQEPEEEPN